MHDQVPAIGHPPWRALPTVTTAARPQRHHPANVRAVQAATGLVTVFVLFMVVQLVHTFEHSLQLLHWFTDQTVVYMTPWAIWTAQALADLFAGGYYMAGLELLHLIGNMMFQAGILTGLVIAHRRLLHARKLRQAAWVQGVHVVEHVALTVTVFTGGVALGVSSLFGLLEPMSLAWIAMRVLFHFTINLVAFWLAVAGAPRPLRHPANPGQHERSWDSWVRSLHPQPAAAAPRATGAASLRVQPAGPWPTPWASAHRNPAAAPTRQRSGQAARDASGT